MASHSNKGNNTGRRDDYGDSYQYRQSSSHYEDIYSGNKRKKQKTRSKKVRNVLIVVLSIIFAVTGSVMVYGYNTLGSLNYDPLDSSSTANGLTNTDVDAPLLDIDINGNKLLSDPMVLNILLFGSDSYSAGDSGRADSILMVSIDNRHKKLKLTSFLRDIYVSIPGYGEDKLNAAYAYGGPRLAIETIERNFGVDVDRYAVADFPGFEAIINRLGGIDLELTAEECEYLNTHCDDPNKLYGDGMKHLSGLQALNHARNRDSIMSDFDRTSRQRDVLGAVVTKMKTANLAQITGIIADVGPMVTTNLKKNEIVTLVANSITYMNYPMSEFSLPELDNFSNEYIDGAAVLLIDDMDQARYDLAKFIFEDSIQSKDGTTSSLNSTH